MSRRLRELLGSDYLYFYDAIAPIVEADSLDISKLFWQSRYGKGEGDDYLNAPMDKEQYLAFHQAVLEAEVVAAARVREGACSSKGCLPIEELARRGVDTLRYGPMKPVGLTAPDGRRPWAVVQLRQENLAKSQFNLVGFQSRMKWGEQQRVLRMIPGLENARVRALRPDPPQHVHQRADPPGQALPGPKARRACASPARSPASRAISNRRRPGLAIGLYLALERQGRTPEPFPATTALGALARHLTESDPKHFQPANINYGLFDELPGRVRKGDRRAAFAERARDGAGGAGRRARARDSTGDVQAPVAG